MSAIADLINKIIWQCSVYFQGLDLRAEVQGWDTVYPTYTHADTLTQRAAQVRARGHMHADSGGLVVETKGHPDQWQALKKG